MGDTTKPELAHLAADATDENSLKKLDEDYQAAFEFIGSPKAKRISKLQSDDIKLAFYGRHKIVSQGKCNTSPPWAVAVRARAKWNAWNDLGSMTKEQAK